MNFILLAVLKNIRRWLSCKKSQNNKYQELLECEIPTTDTELDLKEQAKQIQWIKDNVATQSGELSPNLATEVDKITGKYISPKEKEEMLEIKKLYWEAKEKERGGSLNEDQAIQREKDLGIIKS